MHSILEGEFLRRLECQEQGGKKKTARARIPPSFFPFSHRLSTVLILISIFPFPKLVFSRSERVWNPEERTSIFGGHDAELDSCRTSFFFPPVAVTEDLREPTNWRDMWNGDEFFPISILGTSSSLGFPNIRVDFATEREGNSDAISSRVPIA